MKFSKEVAPMKKWLAGILVLVLAMTCIPMVIKAEEEPILVSPAQPTFSISIAILKETTTERDGTHIPQKQYLSLEISTYWVLS